MRAGACNSDDLGDDCVVLSVLATVTAGWADAGTFTIPSITGVEVTNRVACGVSICTKTGVDNLALGFSNRGGVIAQAQSGNNEAVMQIKYLYLVIFEILQTPHFLREML